MIVVIAGMQRSGSTFSFNVARELLQSRGSVAIVSTNSLEEAFSVGRNAEHLIIKTHAPDEKVNSLIATGEFKCVCTIRKPEDAIASWMSVFSFQLEESVAIITKWLAWHRSMHRHVLNISYEDIDRQPLLAILQIGNALVPDLSLIEVLHIWWRYRKKRIKKEMDHLAIDNGAITNIGFSFYDSRTFFHRRHISSLKSISAEQQLSAAELRFIRDQIRAYIDSQGNYKWRDSK